jgi:MFS family permease
VCFAAFGSLFTGYSLAVFAFTIGQPTFYISLGLTQNPSSPGYSHTSDIIGAANGVFFGTGFLGCFLAGWAGNRFGRVNGFRIASVIGIVGGALQCGSQSPAMVRLIVAYPRPHTVDEDDTVFGCASCSWVGSRPHNGRHANLFHRGVPSSFSGSDHRCTRDIH